MGQKVVVSPDACCVFTWLYGTVIDADLNAVVMHIRDSESFQSSFNELVDLSQASTFEVSSIALEGAGHDCSSLFRTPAKRVIVAPTDIAFGISRMFQVWAESEAEPVYVVRSKSEACALLKLKESELPRFDAGESAHL